MDFIKKQGDQMMGAAKGGEQKPAQGQGGLNLSDGFQASDVKAVAGGKAGVNLADGIDKKDAEGVFNAFKGGNGATTQGQPAK
mmetsp:Transcript_20711/g.62414  ORF Transcript_20711/g.62414 Transcript_20711/m.62414 type:complete len:83 (+) Transcript_20711:91-339(+)